MPGFEPDRPIDPRLRHVTYTVQSEEGGWNDERQYAEPGPMSVALVYDGAPRSFRGYCVDASHTIQDTVHEGFLYSSYEALPASSGIVHPESLDLLNYAIDRFRAGTTFTPPDAPAFEVTDWHVQELAWALVSTGGGTGDPSFDAELAALEAEARAQGEGFRPGPGHHGAVLIIGEDNFDPEDADVQTLMIDVLKAGQHEWRCYDPADPRPCVPVTDGGTPDQPDEPR